MSNLKVVALTIFGILVVGGGIMLAVYLLNGGEGDSTNIPTNPSEVVQVRETGSPEVSGQPSPARTLMEHV